MEKDIWWEFGRHVPLARPEEDCEVGFNARVIEPTIDVFPVARTVPNGSLEITSLHPRVFQPITRPLSYRVRFRLKDN